MNFEHTEDRRMLSDMLQRFVADQYSFPVRDKHAHSAEGFSSEHWARYAELGAIGALFTETDGGFGGAGFDISVVFEALGRGLAVEPFLGALMAGSAIAHASRPAASASSASASSGSASAAPATSDNHAILADIVSGERIAAFAHGEPESFYELARVATQARREGEQWIIDGAKAVVAQGERADVFVVSARTSRDIDDEHGISLFVIPADAAGVQRRGFALIDGGRAAELTLNDVRVPAGALLGRVDEGYATIEHAVGRGIVALCAEAVGAMDAARDATLEYLRTRKQFGMPIGSFQALQHRMADVLLEIEQARSAVINAAAALDDQDRRTRERALSAAKYTIGRVGILVAEECIQLHGGIGMTWELPLAHYAKRLVMIDHQLGDEDFHLERYVALGQS